MSYVCIDLSEAHLCDTLLLYEFRQLFVVYECFVGFCLCCFSLSVLLYLLFLHIVLMTVFCCVCVTSTGVVGDVRGVSCVVGYREP